MLQDARRYMDALQIVDERLAEYEKAIFDIRTPDDIAHDFRLRRKELADIRSLMTGETDRLPHS